MEKVTSINRDLYLGEYRNPRYVARSPESLIFAVGVVTTIGLPQLILSAYGGVVVLITLAVVMAVGSVAGLLAYRYLPYRMPRCVDAEIDVQSPPSKKQDLKKAA